MAETTTANYGWTMPDPGASANTWGATLNATTQKVDAQVFANQTAGVQGAVPVGAVTMFAGGAAPANWLICDGSSLATTGTYAALFAILGYAFGGSGANFNLPNLQQRFPLGANPTNALGSTGGFLSQTLSAAQLPAHTHTITQVAHTHTASQPAHTHADAGHAHSITDQQHSHSMGGSYGFGIGAVAPNALNNQGSSNTSASGTGITGTNAGAANIQAAQPAITVNPTTPTGPTATGSVGSGAVVPTVPPFQAINFIIKYQ